MEKRAASMKQFQVVIVGAGPAGLSAAIEAARAGASVLVVDENTRPGGQLFKQIHKFFGSSEHHAGVRGFEIGRMLLEEIERLGVEVQLSSVVLGIEEQHLLWIVQGDETPRQVHADRIVLATGATENAVPFPGWDLPGVMSAGAAQTMTHVNRVLPGETVVMIGSGNVGVIVSYQLLQAGANVAAIVEAAPKLTGYGVHTAKVRRAGIPFFPSHTVRRVMGESRVEAVELVKVDARFRPVPGTEFPVCADTVCIATGLTPLIELGELAGCQTTHIRALGGFLPLHDRRMQTSVPTIYAAGDIAGVEEASTAMEEGRLAGVNAAASLGLIAGDTAVGRTAAIWESLDALRSGRFGRIRYDFKQKILQCAEERFHV